VTLERGSTLEEWGLTLEERGLTLEEQGLTLEERGLTLEEGDFGREVLSSLIEGEIFDHQEMN